MSDRLSADFRPRKPHSKSRGGCLRCKQRRKKCDEAKPQCTRCAGLRQVCEYPTKRPASRPFVKFIAPAISVISPTSSPTTPSSSDNSTSPREQETLYLSPATSTSPGPRSPSPNPMAAMYQGGTYHSLDDMERELLQFYVCHTAATVAFDDADLYALQFGIPQFALQGWSLMRSVLALAAVSKCHILMAAQGDSPSAQRSALDLLSRAERYHADALRRTQDDISVDGRLDMVLANAPLMVLYSSASRSVRVGVAQKRAAKRHSTDSRLPSDFVPAHPDWISLVRAAHSAYSGIFGSRHEDDSHETSPGIIGPWPAVPTTLNQRAGVAREDGPKTETKTLLLPLICATAPGALEKLAATLPASAAFTDNGTTDQRYTSAHQALEVISWTVAGMRASSPSFLTVAGQKPQPRPDDTGDDAASKVPPWLQAYLARVTMHESSSPLRRTITAFINRTPPDYLQLVLGLLASEDTEPHRQLDRTELFALDVFAHWLVLVLLLDGVWWLGGIGMWELRRVVDLMKRQRGGEDDVDWWPEAMYRLARQI